MNGWRKMRLRDEETKISETIMSKYKDEIDYIYLLGYEHGGYDAMHFNPNGNLCRECNFYHIDEQKRPICSLWMCCISDHSDKSCAAYETKRKRHGWFKKCDERNE